MINRKEIERLHQVYAIGEESAFAVMAARLKAGVRIQGLSWDIIEDHIASIDWEDDDGYHCVFHYLGTPLVFFTVPDDEEGMILISHPTEPGQKLSDDLLR